MKKSKFTVAIIAVTSLTLLSGMAMAGTGKTTAPSYHGKQMMDMGLDTPVSNLTSKDRAMDEEWRMSYPSEELYKKHREIDKYVFEDHADQIEENGFFVTHTGPRDGLIEIGITPFSEESANYLYKVFGSDIVKVVEGQKAVTLPLNAAAGQNVAVDSDMADEANVISEDLSIGVRIDGWMLPLDVEPIIEEDRTLIPLRGVMEGLGAAVEWDQETSTVSISTENVNIELVIGETNAKVVKTTDEVPSEETIELDVAAKLVNDRTFVPVRFVSETLGAEVDWDNTLRIVIIETEAEENEGLSLRDFFPLTAGSTWQYQGEGNEYAPFSREVLFVDDNRAQVSEDNGGTVSASVFEFQEDQIIRTFFRGEEYDGNNLLDEEANDDMVLLKAPLEVGTKWETSNGTREIVETDAIVNTLAGNFENCLRIEIATDYSVMYEYYKEGVGLIKREFLSEGMAVTSTLEEYSIK